MLSGIRRFTKRQKACGGKSLFRDMAVVSWDREVRKLVQQMNWFHDKDPGNSDHPDEQMFSKSGLKSGPRRSKHLIPKDQAYRPSSVLFVPRTEGGCLLYTSPSPRD